MPIITKSAITKGTPAPFSLSKADLLAHATVQANAYFSDINNWKAIAIAYVSSVGNQKKTLLFKASETVPTADFKLTAAARDIFEVVSVTIFDFDGGSLTIPRSALNEAAFDVDVTPITALWMHDFSNGTIAGSSGYVYTVSNDQLSLNKAANSTNHFSNVPSYYFDVNSIVPQSAYNVRVYIDEITPPENLATLMLNNNAGNMYSKSGTDVANELLANGYVEFTSVVFWFAAMQIVIPWVNDSLPEVSVKISKIEIHPI